MEFWRRNNCVGANPKGLDQKIIENIKAGLKTKIPPADDGSVKYSAYVNAIQGKG
jgi:hypothetical protein